jgi:hypothetical protein
MAEIKTALELAMERTESVVADKSSIEQYEAKQRGKKAANRFMSDGTVSIEAALKGERATKAGAGSGAFREGLLDILLTWVKLPTQNDDLAKIENAGAGLQALIADRQLPALFKQFVAAAARYLDDIKQCEEAIRRQYQGRLQAKEAELSRQMGTPVRIDPFQDPEFVAFYNKNMSALKANYQAMVDQVRVQILASAD